METKRVEIVSGGKRNSELRDFGARWALDGDYIRCRECKRAQLADYHGLRFPHAADCPSTDSEPHPWQTLSGLVATIPPVSAHPVIESELHLTAERLTELLRLDADTGQIYWRVPHKRLGPKKIGAEAGFDKWLGYREIVINGRSYRAHRVVFALVHGRWPNGQVDHINGNPGDNRPCNLREASIFQNSGNRRGHTAQCPHGYRGVSLLRGKYRARMKINGREITLGRFDDAKSAGRAYAKAAVEIYGDFAHPSLKALAAEENTAPVEAK